MEVTALLPTKLLHIRDLRVCITLPCAHSSLVANEDAPAACLKRTQQRYPWCLTVSAGRYSQANPLIGQIKVHIFPAAPFFKNPPPQPISGGKKNFTTRTNTQKSIKEFSGNRLKYRTLTPNQPEPHRKARYNKVKAIS